MPAKLSFAALALLALPLAACGTPAVGEPCAGSPQLGGCVEGAVCVLDEESPVTADDSQTVWDSYTCRQRCTSHADCGGGFSCEIVPTTPSISACVPRSSP